MAITLATHRALTGPSMLVYTSDRGPERGFDLYLSWPGRHTPSLIATGPNDEMYPGWSPACASDAGTSCRLAYLSVAYQPDGEVQRALFTVRPDGTGRADLCAEGQAGVQYSWSPRGDALVVELRDDIGSDIVILRAEDGAHLARLTDDPAQDLTPFWSPDGTQIAFRSFRGGEASNQGKIVVVTLDDAYQPITDHVLTAAATVDDLRGWSPDGAWVLYASAQFYEPPATETDVFMARPDGTETHQLTTHPRSDSAPVWSPDGAWIVFQSRRDGTEQAYVTRPAAGIAPELVIPASSYLTHNQVYEQAYRVSSLDANASELVWSPDGAWLVVRQALSGDSYHLLVQSATLPDTRDQRRLFPDDNLDWGMAWSPDGQWIAFETMRDFNREVYAVRPDGSGLVNISRHGGVDAAPVWSPPIERPYRPARLLPVGIAALVVIVGRRRSQAA